MKMLVEVIEWYSWCRRMSRWRRS